MTTKKNTLAEELTYRGLVNQHTGESIDEITSKERTLYLGIDPTGDSLHVGNLLILMAVRRFYEHGHKIIILVGGATATIGDPSGKTEERVLMDEKTVEENANKIRKQIQSVINTEDFKLVDNNDWLSKVSILEFLRDTGKYFTVNDMLRKESVKRRIEDPESSISFTEFAYMLLQAHDFSVLNEKYGCDLQVGGSDQWGNIVTGVELIRKKKQTEAHAFTIPLLLDKSTGRKFGKSEKGAVWLDAKKTSPFHFYQFWYNTEDESAREYLKYYTTLEESEIEKINKDSEASPEMRIAQTALAYEVTAIVHGKETAEKIKNISVALYSGDFKKLTHSEKEVLLSSVPSYKMVDEKGISIIDLLTETELATSKREARTFVESGAVTLRGEKIDDVEKLIKKGDVKDAITILKKGKRDIMLLYKD